MNFIKITKDIEVFNQSSEFSFYSFWIEAFTDPDLQVAILTTNINMLRRRAPFFYLFCNGFTIDSWLKEDIGCDDNYRYALDAKQMKRGLWLSNISRSAPVETVVTAILSGDIFPFAHLLGADEFSLLCLPYQVSLNNIDDIISSSNTNEDAVLNMIYNGGFVVTAIDLVRFKFLVNNKWCRDQGEIVHVS